MANLNTITDPVFLASPAFGISSINITNWNTAFGWGNHAGLYVPLARTVTAGTGFTGGGALSANITLSANFGTAVGTIAQGNDSRINNGQTAFSWGDHASAGYELLTNKATDLTAPDNTKYPTTLAVADAFAAIPAIPVQTTGSWTPTGTHISGSGSYILTGKFMVAFFAIAIATNSDASQLVISGLPFADSSTTGVVTISQATSDGSFGDLTIAFWGTYDGSVPGAFFWDGFNSTFAARQFSGGSITGMITCVIP